MASPDASAIHEEPTAEVEIIDLTGDTESESEDDEDEDKYEDEEEDDGEEESADELNSDGSEVVIHLNEETRTQLRNAISTVSESRLREMLKTFVGTELAVEAALTRELVTVRRDTHAVVPRWETCATCGVEYDINLPRGNDECTFHPGTLFNLIVLFTRSSTSQVYWRSTRRHLTRAFRGPRTESKISNGLVAARMGAAY